MFSSPFLAFVLFVVTSRYPAKEMPHTQDNRRGLYLTRLQPF
jgi:hypothetical protein